MSLSFVAEQTGGIDKGWHSKARNGGVKTLGDGVDAPRRHLRAKVTVSSCH
jgi:hypothetical protein